MLNNTIISLNKNTSVIEFTIKPNELQGLEATLGNIIRKRGIDARFEFLEENSAHPKLNITLEDFPLLEPYLLANPSLGLKKDVLKDEVDRLIREDRLQLEAGLITNGRTNSTIANMMLSKAFEIPIRHITFDCPLHCEGEMWSKILIGYSKYITSNSDRNSTARVIWSSHGERLTNGMFEALSKRTKKMAVYTRNPNQMFTSALDGRVVNSERFGGDIRTVLEEHLLRVLPDEFLKILTDSVEVKASLQKQWQEVRNANDKVNAVEDMLNHYAHKHSTYDTWDKLTAYARRQKDYTAFSDVIDYAYETLAPEDMRSLPSSKLYPLRSPFRFSVRSFQKQLDFLHKRQEQGLPVIVVDSSSIKTTDHLRQQFATGLGVQPEDLLLTNIQDNLPKDLIVHDHTTTGMVGKTLASDEIKRPDKTSIPLKNFPKSIKNMLETELEIYGKLMSDPAAIGPKSFEDLKQILCLDTKSRITEDKTLSEDHPKALVNVDILFCLVMATNYYRNTMNKDTLTLIGSLSKKIPDSLQKETQRILDAMMGPTKTEVRTNVMRVLKLDSCKGEIT